MERSWFHRTVAVGLMVVTATAAVAVGADRASAQATGVNRQMLCTLSYAWNATSGVSGSGLCVGSGIGTVAVDLEHLYSRGGSGCPTEVSFFLRGVGHPEQVVWRPGANPLAALGGTVPAVVSGPVGYGDSRLGLVWVGRAVLAGTDRCGDAVPSLQGLLVLETNIV